jgi:hypothetical protein
MSGENDARPWLRTIGMAALADKIDEIMQSWKDRGLKTRRNWWEALGGTPKGAPMTVEGVTFPIIAAVRMRRGLDPVSGSIKLPAHVVVPPPIPQARWRKVAASKRAIPTRQKKTKPGTRSKRG